MQRHNNRSDFVCLPNVAHWSILPCRPGEIHHILKDEETIREDLMPRSQCKQRHFLSFCASILYYLIIFDFIILIVKWFKLRSLTGEAISTTYSPPRLKIPSIARRASLFPLTYLTSQPLKSIFPSSLLMAHFTPMESISMEGWALEEGQISSFQFTTPRRLSSLQGLQSWNAGFHMSVFN